MGGSEMTVMVSVSVLRAPAGLGRASATTAVGAERSATSSAAFLSCSVALLSCCSVDTTAAWAEKEGGEAGSKAVVVKFDAAAESGARAEVGAKARAGAGLGGGAAAACIEACRIIQSMTAGRAGVRAADSTSRVAGGDGWETSLRSVKLLLR